MRKFTGLLILLFAAQSTFGDCFDDAAVRHKVTPEILRCIACVESDFNKEVVMKNKNGSLDIGLMQINTLWLDDLLTFGIEPDHLLDACINIHVAAWILSKEIQRHGFTWQAIGAYHTGSRDDTHERQLRRYNYAKKVYSKQNTRCYRNATVDSMRAQSEPSDSKPTTIK